jgi:protoporphyrinogen oxidase
MRELVIIGGGLTGLAAAYECEKRGIAYTLIEVKRRLGGGIATKLHGGFVFDTGKMTHHITDRTAFMAYLKSLGLAQAVIELEGERLAFTDGTGVLINALAAKITAPVMQRMAVSSLGGINDGGPFSICMENGMVLDTRGLIIAAPACYAERMLYTLVPESAYKLLNYPYDTIARVSLGYEALSAQFRAPHAAPLPRPSSDAEIVAVRRLSHPNRNPEHGGILQADIRYDAGNGLPEDQSQWVNKLIKAMNWPRNPAATHMGLWPESDPAIFRQPDHSALLGEINRSLPESMALVGSDYVLSSAPPRLDERIEQGIAAARRIAAILKNN